MVTATDAKIITAASTDTTAHATIILHFFFNLGVVHCTYKIIQYTRTTIHAYILILLLLTITQSHTYLLYIFTGQPCLMSVFNHYMVL